MQARRKILPLAELQAKRAELAAQGKTVVQCHGCFDIVHPGHIRYLRFARDQGDALIVSVSADEVVGKGHDRPYINEELRMENLAALEFVDYVVLDRHTWAGPVLEALTPDIYVKGREYETNSDPRFLRERRVVEEHGGKVIFSSGDVVFSSTAIIARYREKFALEQERVAFFCRHHGLDRDTIDTALEACIDKRVLVVGDPILDCYVHCEGANVAAESPIVSVSPVSEEWYAGGGALIAAQLAALGARVGFLTVLDPEHPGSVRFRDALEAQGVTVYAVPVERRPVYEKTRYLVGGTKVFKVDRGHRTEIASAAVTRLVGLLEEHAAAADAVVATDFGYGLFGPALVDALAATSARTGTPYFADVSGNGRANVLKFRAPLVATPTEDELRFSLGDRESGLSHIASRYFHETGAHALALTLGQRGVILFHPEAGRDRLRTDYLPSLGTVPVDAVGAGDQFLSGVVAARIAGASEELGLYVGSALAAVHLGRLGNETVPLVLLEEFLDGREELRR